MFDFILKIFDTSDFPPRWECGHWTTGHGWLHIASDVATWGAYTAIPCVLAYFVLKRKQDVVFPRIFWLFGAFILACGLVHLIEATIFWWPVYRLSGVVKLITAVVSWATVVALMRVTPQAMALPGLTTINRALQREMAERGEAENRFRLVVEASPSSIIVVDGQGVIALVNSETEKLFGYTRDELIGRSVDMLVPERYRDKHSTYRAAFVQQPQSRPMGAGRDLYGRRKDGSEVPIEIGLNPLHTEDGLMVLSAVLDITERKRAERELQRTNDDLQRKNEEMEQFVYTVSHDLKSPLVTITGFLGILKEDAAAGRVDDVLDAVARIEGAADHMTELIEDLLQLSRIGHVADSINDVDMREVVRDVASRLAKRLEKAGATLTVQSDMPYVLGDRPRLTEVVENLLTNAVKYGCRGTSPTVRVGATVENGETRFYVSDDGPGIAPQYHEKIFGLFQRLDTRQEGTGVGLAIARRIVEAHGGRIWVESRPGHGATFWFVLPTEGAA